MSQPSHLILEISSISKAFGAVQALSGVSFSVAAGEVHGLVGENGAGKSTLMAIASGALAPDSGTVTINGVDVGADPDKARELGLAIVRLEPSLMPDLTVAENLYLGLPTKARPGLGAMHEAARKLLLTWSDDVAIDPGDRVNTLNPEQRFIVEIVKALAAAPRILVLDEPTEHLAAEDVRRLFQRIHEVAARGTGVVYISHRIREVREIAQRLTVLRDGKGQGTYAVETLGEQQIVELIVGSALDREFPAKASPGTKGVPALQVSGLSGSGFSNVSLAVKAGEIVGLAGIDGNGQREFMRALAGMQGSRGEVLVGGTKAQVQSSNAAAASGIRYLPGDRHREGIFAELSVRENFALRSMGRDLVAGFVNPRRQARRAEAAVADFSVKTPDIETPIGSLSGGNQQKLVFASVLASEPAVLLVDEPTQGVDIGARMEIYKILREIAAQGTAIIVRSSDAEEVAGLSDRVNIFSRGRIVQELVGAEVTESNITKAVLTSTTLRERVAHKARDFWQWAAGDAAPLALLALTVILLGAYASVASDNFLTPRNLGGIFAQVATLALVAYGQQALMLAGGIDLSVGPLMGLVVVVESFFLVAGVPVTHQWFGWALVLLVSAGVGLVNWALVEAIKLHPMVATLATFMALQAVSLILRPVPGGLIDEPVMDMINARIGFVPVSALLALVVALGLEYALYRSRWGVSVRGFGSRREAARVAGVRPRATLLVAYLMCSVLAGCAAVLMMGQVGSGDATAGVSYTLTSIAAVVIGGASIFGGRGSFIGCLLGALLIVEINAVTAFLDLSDAWQSYLLGGMILASVALYSKSRQMAVAA